MCNNIRHYAEQLQAELLLFFEYVSRLDEIQHEFDVNRFGKYGRTTMTIEA